MLSRAARSVNHVMGESCRSIEDGGALAGHIPALKAGQEYPDYKNNPKRALWSKQRQLGFKLPPVHPDQWRWLEAICAAIAVKVIDRELTAEQAAAEAQKQLDELLPQY